MQEIVNVISTVGFPIVCCLLMFKQNSSITEALNNNTKVIAELKTKLDTLLNAYSELKEKIDVK